MRKKRPTDRCQSGNLIDEGDKTFLRYECLEMNSKLSPQPREERFLFHPPSVFMESEQQPVIPGLPDDLALRCLARISHGFHGSLHAVCKSWRDLLCSNEYADYKASKGWCGNWLFVLTENAKNHWIAYDPDADIWHHVPKIPDIPDGWLQRGFSCVCVRNQLLVIGGSYTSEPTLNYQEPLIINDVFKFDPFRNHWSRVASMRTPRTCFACSVIAGKVYVAGGRNSSSPDGAVCLAEVYDPELDRWEELPPMPKALVNCIGISYMGNFRVLSDLVGLGQNTSEVFCPANQTWCSVKDNWPFSRAMQFSVQVIDDSQLYTLVDSGENLVKTRDSEKEDWYTVGSVPPVHLSNHSRPLEAFDYGFAALNHELYVLGGKVLKWEESGVGRFEIVRLGVMRVFNPTERPIKWRETRPMCQFLSGTVLGCATMQENFSPGPRYN